MREGVGEPRANASVTRRMRASDSAISPSTAARSASVVGFRDLRPLLELLDEPGPVLVGPELPMQLG